MPSSLIAAMAEFDDEQIRQLRQIVREERPSTNWGRVFLWVGVVIFALVALTYLASSTLQPA